jgi:type 1 glutamine amidotransferase
VRRRAFDQNVMDMVRQHIKGGKPVIGIRTASHAFQLRKETLPVGHQEWTNWDHEIIGGNYNGHLGKGLTCQIYQTSKVLNHEILDEVKLPFPTPATLYRNSPLPKSSTALLTGEVKGHPPEPVAWINKTTSGGKVFYTSLGHVDDFKKPAFHQLLKNGIKWCLTRD